AEGLANRRPADAVSGGQVVLYEPRAGAELEVRDRLLQLPVNVVLRGRHGPVQVRMPSCMQAERQPPVKRHRRNRVRLACTAGQAATGARVCSSCPKRARATKDPAPGSATRRPSSTTRRPRTYTACGTP